MATSKLSPLTSFNVAAISFLVGRLESGIDIYTTQCVKWMASGKLVAQHRDLSLVLYDEGEIYVYFIADALE